MIARALSGHAGLVYINDYEHIDVVSNFSRFGAFGQSWAGGGSWTVFKPPVWPAGFHVLLAPFFLLFGARPAVAVDFNAFLCLLCVAAAFALTWELFESEVAAAAAAVLTALLPSLLAVSESAGLSPLSFLSILMSLLAFARWRRRSSPAAYALLWSWLAVAAQSRQENLLLAAALGLPAFLASLKKGRSAACFAVDGAALASLLAGLSVFWRNKITGVDVYDATPLSALEGLRHHLAGNVLYLLPLALLAWVGWRDAARRGPKAPARYYPALAGLFAVFFAAVVNYDFFFWNGVKYSLSAQAALLPLAALGAARLLKRAPLPAGALLAAALLALSWRGVSAHERSLSGERARDAFLDDASRFLPADALVITHLPPSVIVRAKREAVDARLAVEDWSRIESRAGGSTLVLFRDYWAPTQPETVAALDKLIAKDFRTLPLREIKLGDLTYGFYRLEAKKR